MNSLSIFTAWHCKERSYGASAVDAIQGPNRAGAYRDFALRTLKGGVLIVNSSIPKPDAYFILFQ